jgi:hypothetical protein
MSSCSRRSEKSRRRRGAPGRFTVPSGNGWRISLLNAWWQNSPVVLRHGGAVVVQSHRKDEWPTGSGPLASASFYAILARAAP